MREEQQHIFSNSKETKLQKFNHPWAVNHSLQILPTELNTQGSDNRQIELPTLREQQKHKQRPKTKRLATKAKQNDLFTSLRCLATNIYDV